jgi:hypothetical protein
VVIWNIFPILVCFGEEKSGNPVFDLAVTKVFLAKVVINQRPVWSHAFN